MGILREEKQMTEQIDQNPEEEASRISGPWMTFRHTSLPSPVFFLLL